MKRTSHTRLLVPLLCLSAIHKGEVPNASLDFQISYFYFEGPAVDISYSGPAESLIQDVADRLDISVDSTQLPSCYVKKLKLSQAEWRSVFDIVLEPCGYIYLEGEEIIRILKKDEER